jgi:hypothetical protein
MAVSTALPVAASHRLAWILALFLGLLSLTAVNEMRLVCRNGDFYMRDDLGILMTDNALNLIRSDGEEGQCHIVTGNIRIPRLGSEGIGQL